MLCKGGFGSLVYICTQFLNSGPNKSVICLGRENVNGKDERFGGFFFAVVVGFFFNKGSFQFKPSQFM